MDQNVQEQLQGLELDDREQGGGRAGPGPEEEM